MTPSPSTASSARWRLPSAILLTILILVSLALTARKSDFQMSLLGQAFVADAGFELSVPKEVVDARALVMRQPHDLSPLSLGQGLKDDELIRQRMWEALYPQRFSDADTPHRILRATDPVLNACQLIDRRGDVVLADCR